MGMGSVRDPRGLLKNGVLTTPTGGANWNLVVDISVGDDDRQRFENHSMEVMNLDASITIDISVDNGATILCRLIPGRCPGRFYDFFGLPHGKIWEKHSSGTPDLEFAVWA